MRTIEDLSVTVKYRVGLGKLNVTDEVYKQLEEIAEKGIELDGTGTKYPEANDWLHENIREADCCDIEYEITELS